MSPSESGNPGKMREDKGTTPRLPRGTIIDGAHWPMLATAERIRSAKAMKPRADDVFICTYPKSGTTWVQHIVHQLMGKAEYDNVNADNQSSKKAMTHISPMIEFTGAAFPEKLESPRILKSHFSYRDVPKGGGAKYIYVCRNPKDCLTSYYHHHRLLKAFDFENGDFDVFFNLFMDGKVPYGDYFNHIISWLDGIEQKEERILLLKYEDMVADLRSAVIQIANFLGGKAAEIVSNEEELSCIVSASTLDAMKKNQDRWVPSILKNGKGEFIRKGGSGDWKNHFSPEQSARMDKRFRERCATTAAAEWWQAEMAWNANHL